MWLFPDPKAQSGVNIPQANYDTSLLFSPVCSVTPRVPIRLPLALPAPGPVLAWPPVTVIFQLLRSLDVSCRRGGLRHGQVVVLGRTEQTESLAMGDSGLVKAIS